MKRTLLWMMYEGQWKSELAGPGNQLGYRAMHKKFQQLYEFNAPQGLVYGVMYHLDPK